MKEIRALLLLPLLFFLIISFATAKISAYPEEIKLFSGDEFTVNVSFLTDPSESAVLEAVYDSALISLLWPGEIIDFRRGGFSGTLNYRFLAIDSGETEIKFKIGDEEAIVYVEISPRYLKLETIDEVIVEKGENFSLPIRVEAMNVDNVSLSLNYNKNILLAESDEILIGSGSFTKDIKVKFNVFGANEKELINIKVCSSIGCEKKEVSVKIKFLEFNITKPTVFVGKPFEFKLNIKSFNYEDINLSIDYDKEWFEIKELPKIDGDGEKVIRFFMKEDGPGCPNKSFKFKISSDGKIIEKETRVKISPFSLLEIKSNGVRLNENEKVRIIAKAFGIENVDFVIIYPKDKMNISGFDGEKSYIKKGILEKEILIKKKGNECINYDKEIYVNVKDRNLAISALLLKDEEVINSTTHKFVVLDVKSLEKLPILPPRAIYPEVVIICTRGSYNPETDKCEYYPKISIICEGGEYYPYPSVNYSKIINFTNTTEDCNIKRKVKVVGDLTGYQKGLVELLKNSINKNVKIKIRGEFKKNWKIYVKVDGELNQAQREILNALIKSINRTRIPVKIFIRIKVECGYKTSVFFSHEFEDDFYNVTINSELLNRSFYFESFPYSFIEKNFRLKINKSGILINLTTSFQIIHINITISKIGICIWHPPEIPVCEKGEYNPETGMCEYYPETEIICENGTYNEETGKCEYVPEVEYICTKGEYNESTGKCEFYPIIDYICFNGSYNESSGMCEVFPNTSYICEIGRYSPEIQKCIYYPETEIICENGTYNEETGKCEYVPEVEYLCEVGDYNSSRGVCEVEPEVVYKCDEGEYNEELNACIVRVRNVIKKIKSICEIGEYDPELDACVYYPNKTVCENGVFDSKLGLCVFKPETKIVCEKGRYDNKLKACVYEPDIDVFESVEISTKVNEIISISVEIKNPNDYKIFNITTSLSPKNYTLVNYRIEKTELEPNETTKATYLIKFEKPGIYNLTLKVKNNESYSIKKYKFNVLPAESSITGFAIFKKSPVFITLLLTITVSVFYIISKLIFPK